MAYPNRAEIIVPPSGDIITAEVAREFLGLPTSGGDAGLSILLGTAHEMVDGPDSQTGWCWREHQLKVYYYGYWPTDGFDQPDILPHRRKTFGWIYLPGPVPSTATVEYREEGEDDLTAYTDGTVVRLDGRDWLRLPEAIPAGYDSEIRASYTTEAETVPDGIKSVILALTAHMWSERSFFLSAGRLAAVENDVITSILARYRVAPRAY